MEHINAANRGSLRAIRATLSKINEIVTDIMNTENQKEWGDTGGAPLMYHHPDHSSSLEDVCESLQAAIDGLEEIASERCDWE